MADGFLQVFPDSTGKRMDSEIVSRGGVDYYRERDVLYFAAYPVRDCLSSANLAAGSSVNLDGTTIAATKTGKLLGVQMASSAACKWIVKTRDGAIELTMGTVFTSGIAGQKPSDSFRPPDKQFCTLLGNGVDENFRVTATNLDQENAADVYVTIWWDEIPG